LEQSVERIIERNLLEVFNGRDADSRRATIDELWDKDGVFIDPGGVHEGVEKINAVAELLFTQFEGYVFSVRGRFTWATSFRYHPLPHGAFPSLSKLRCPAEAI